MTTPTKQPSVPSAEPPFDMLAHLKRQAEFSAKTFGPGARVEGVTDHIAKELREVCESGGDLSEWVDVIILAFDGAWRSGASPAQIIDAMVAKQTKNEGRKWPDWRTAPADKAIEHDRSGEVGTAPTAPSPLPAALLVRDLAANLSVEPLDVCKALDDLGHGQYSVNMAVPAAAVGAVERYFGAAPQAAPLAPEPIPVEAVAEVVDTADGLELRWLIEGGIAAMAEGCVLVMPHRTITDDCGYGEVYTTPPAAPAPTIQPLPARLVRFTLRDLKAERKRLDGFISLGNEIERAAEYDEWIAALEAYCTAHGITAAPTKE